MRTYGEAFIIADQAPGLLDMSAIRNTNTKIVLRLPDYSDRELVGKSANLNDEQIAELAKLKTGVAAVYQNNWLSPVLCQFDKYEANEKVYVKADKHDIGDVAETEILNIIMKSDIRKKLDNVDYRETLVNTIIKSVLPDWLKVKVLTYLKSDEKKVKDLAQIAYYFFDAEKVLNQIADVRSVEEWICAISERLKPSIKSFEEEEIDALITLLVKEHYENDKKFESGYLSLMEHIAEKRNLL